MRTPHHWVYVLFLTDIYLVLDLLFFFITKKKKKKKKTTLRKFFFLYHLPRLRMAFIAKVSCSKTKPLGYTTTKLAFELYVISAMLRTFSYRNIATFSAN